ncbi:MAG: RIP metalloprotease RseP [Gemmatimonadetes bacterium]|nr:RIP metalloprotease RseP [Gemmatimonadota bacterium]
MIVTILATAVVLGVLVFVHELGHFITAKKAGIRVPRFSIGLGPRIFGFRRGETEYVLSWIPLGGYVRMAGMADEEATAALEGGDSDTEAGPDHPEDRSGHFDSKPLWARTMVICAGIAMNLLFAMFAFSAVAIGNGISIPSVTSVAPQSPAEQAGLAEGDLILSVDGGSVLGPSHVVMRVARKAGQPVPVVVRRGDRELEFVVTPRAVSVEDADVSAGRIGIGIGQYVGRADLVTAVTRGVRETALWTGAVFQFLGDLFTGESSARDVGGPVMIGELSGRAARSGIWDLLGFMAIISVNLAVFNLLPIPVLDGGHLVFLGIEAVRGRPLAPELRMRVTSIGMAVILVLIVFVLGNDLLRVFSG